MPTLSFADAKERVAEQLRTAVGVDEFDVTSAKLVEIQGVWRFDVEYKKPKAMFPDTAFLILDSTTGEVKEFRKGM
ncbi:MAG: hypothetical protein ABSF83_03000 [Nitrososphaerales archaeon]|jgi:hypothetical protein